MDWNRSKAARTNAKNESGIGWLVIRAVSYALIFSFFLSKTAFAIEPRELLKQRDPVADVHHNLPMCVDQATDIEEVRVRTVDQTLDVVMTMTKTVLEHWGYREYYFWLDVDPSARRGYQPYAPHSVAWPNFFADSRVFLAIQRTRPEDQTSASLSLQDCGQSDCAVDQGLRLLGPEAQFKIVDRDIHFRIPLESIPGWAREAQIMIAFTTYYQFFHCHGEDDAPQWSKEVIPIPLTSGPS